MKKLSISCCFRYIFKKNLTSSVMKHLIFTFFLIIFFCVFISAQSEESVCPIVRVEGLSLIEMDKPLIFRAVFDKNIKNYDIKYEWSVSKGEIIEGQGTATIKAANIGSLTASLKISGLPEHCYNLASETVHYDLPPRATLFDEFFQSNTKINERKLTAFANTLVNDPISSVFIIVNFNKRVTRNKIKQEFLQISKYLQNYQISKEQLIFAIGKKENNITQFWIVPAGGNFPDCRNCEIIKGNDL